MQELVDILVPIACGCVLPMSLLLWLAQNSRLLSATVLALLLSLGTMSIIRNIHDILRMRRAISGTDVQNAFPLFQ